MTDELNIPQPPTGKAIEEWFTYVAFVAKENINQTIELKNIVKELNKKIEEFEEKLSDDVPFLNGGEQAIKISKIEQIKQAYRYLRRGGLGEQYIEKKFDTHVEQYHSPTKTMKKWNDNIRVWFDFLKWFIIIIAFVFLVLDHFKGTEMSQKNNELLKQMIEKIK